jgi:hypothetical protein
MIIKYGIEIDNDAIIKNIDKITNRIFKLLPDREEGTDWQTPLKNLIIEIGGLNSILEDQTILFSLLFKMESLLNLQDEDDFPMYRTVIFECLGLCNSLKKMIV